MWKTWACKKEDSVNKRLKLILRQIIPDAIQQEWLLR